MSKPTNYTKLAASLDYAALEQKLTQLSDRQPPKKRQNAADVLEPLRERLLDLQRKGWGSRQLAEELMTAGVPVSPARLRDCLNRWADGGGKTLRRSAPRRPKVAPTTSSSPASAPPKKPATTTPQGSFTLRQPRAAEPALNRSDPLTPAPTQVASAAGVRASSLSSA